MLVDETGECTITNDGATILKLLDVKHPAAKLLCQIADQQDYEVCIFQSRIEYQSHI